MIIHYTFVLIMLLGLSAVDHPAAGVSPMDRKAPFLSLRPSNGTIVQVLYSICMKHIPLHMHIYRYVCTYTYINVHMYLHTYV